MTITQVTNGRAANWIRLALGIAGILIVPWCVYITFTLRDITLEINRLTIYSEVGGRFTAEHAQQLRMEVQANLERESGRVALQMEKNQREWLLALATLKNQLDMLPQTLVLPPKWWEDYVKIEITTLNQRIKILEGKFP